jgi:alpha-mannosidase
LNINIKELLVLHHSHLDVGYTHSQPVVWELHREYLGQAMDLLEGTADWPEGSRPAWTCEVTAPVLKWMETATGADVARFRALVDQGRLSIGAMQYNTTPLNTAAQLDRQLAPMEVLRRRLGAPIRTAMQFDVNGIPWPAADLLLDHGVDLLIMAVNPHLGAPVRPRPGVFRWRTPSGRELRVMNGQHYTMFDQLLRSWERSLDAMRAGLDEYLEHLGRIGYPHDFLFLTTTAAPEMWDNSPPNMPVARMIRAWNESGREPRIRYVTSEDLRERIQALPADRLPRLSGDWTDYWNFGCASTAAVVARSRAAARTLDLAERQAPEPSVDVRRVIDRARDLLDLFNEHTWSYWDTDGRSEPARVQDHLKAASVFEAFELARFALVHALETLAGNKAQSEVAPDQVLLVNPSPVARTEYVDIPAAWRSPGPRLRCQRFAPAVSDATVEACGPVELPPFGVRRVPLAGLRPAPGDPRIRHEDRRPPVAVPSVSTLRIEAARAGDALIESPTHRLTYDPDTGRILGLFDKTRNWEVAAPGAEYELFDVVRERPDARADGRREPYYERDLDREKFDRSCWKPWRAVRERATRLLECRVGRTAGAVTLERRFEMPGTTQGLRHRLTFRADTDVMALEIELDKIACEDPEALYIALPLNLPAGWRCHFDTAGLPVELDAEQLPGACRSWVTVESFVALHAGGRGVTMYCPDAPMAMAGGFHFGPPLEAVPRHEHPLLLAWPLNNYWNTNFPRTQPGPLRLTWGLRTHGEFDSARARREAAAFAHPILAHPVFS